MVGKRLGMVGASLASLLALVGCGANESVGTDGAASRPGQSATATSRGNAQARPDTTCRSRDLRLSVERGGKPAPGRQTIVVRVTGAGGTKCVIAGTDIPTVSLYDARGGLIDPAGTSGTGFHRIDANVSPPGDPIALAASPAYVLVDLPACPTSPGRRATRLVLSSTSTASPLAAPIPPPQAVYACRPDGRHALVATSPFFDSIDALSDYQLAVDTLIARAA